MTLENLERTHAEDSDDILASLEDEDDSTYRTQRLRELKAAATATATTTVKKSYVTLTGDDETLAFTTEHARAVVHFYHPDFARCNTMDSHLDLVAEKHAEDATGDVAFGKVNVNQAPFVVEKLGVRVLPCVIGFVNGVVKGRVIGFDGVCWDGREGSVEVSRALESAFVEWTVLKKALMSKDDGDDSDEEDDMDARKAARRGIKDRKHENQDDDDDWD
jgi:thiol-disulfide isomerase/thioredoxin